MRNHLYKMSFRTFVPAEFYHNTMQLLQLDYESSYTDQFNLLYVYVVGGDELTWTSENKLYDGERFIVKYENMVIQIQDYNIHENMLEFMERVKGMKDSKLWQEMRAYTAGSIKKFFIDSGSSWTGYTDEYAWGELLKEDPLRDMLVEIIARLIMYWSDVERVNSAIDAFNRKASEQMQQRIKNKMKEIEKLSALQSAQQKLRRARHKLILLVKSPELKFIDQFRKIAEGKEKVPQGIDMLVVKKTWDTRKMYYKSIFNGKDYAKQVAKLIILYNSTKVDGKKIKPPLASYEKLTNEDTWQGEIELGTKDQDNLEHFRLKHSKEKYEEIERAKREKSQREAELRDKKFQKMMDARMAASLK